MYSKKTVIANPTGLHARPASDFIAAAGKFSSKIRISRVAGDPEEDAANAKSIISLLSLGLAQGEEVEVFADGADEKQAVDDLVALIDSKFGESSAG
ncbi:Phosphocarrier protein HPr [Caprobacter fermentans]|uniref:Phosphocarrier protein HPr n=1 Tax=Caproicibacter fermentans TaxID=2576756 RepID=A0A6N8HX58_9FIRM|nr:HPr family phosphocarrier protein [Caproicibacter fermentans]MVB10110.1 Phosphocarrier protein HPr [Caproicibacter fermentans]OCN03375.1 serine kinase [Clostridium sp. W14A]QNK40180.1 HPr family phosphocarrier protein [Caproicibacter fermentans]